MKTIVANFFGRLASRPLVVGVIAALGVGASSVVATDVAYTNNGYTASLPHVDAFTFVNNGTIANIFTRQPAEFSNTKNITNNGVMSAMPGWYFNDSDSGNGVRRLAANFHNENYNANPQRGLIEALDGYPPTQFVYPSDPSYLWIDATNIVNKGVLRVGANGWLRMLGKNINLTRGALEVAPVAGNGSPTGDGIFLPDVGILDIGWDEGVRDINTAGLWDGLMATAAGPPRIQLLNPIADTYSNVVDGIRGGALLTVTNMATNGTLFTTNVFIPTNVVKQAVFVGIPPNSNITAEISFGPSSWATNPMVTAAVLITHYTTNIITGMPEATTVYFYDTLASETNRGLSVNQQGGNTARPANYIISRVPQFFTGIAPSGYPDTRFLYDARSYSNSVGRDAPWSGYLAQVVNTTAEPTAIPAGSFTNVPGRVEIFGDSVNLTRTRVRGEGYIKVNAKHLVSTDQTMLDCENLSLFLGTTNSNLKVANLANENTSRTKGYIYAWSALWNNSQDVLVDNYVVSTNEATGGNVTNNVPITNTVSIRMHCLMLDATELLNQLPVLVYDLNTRGQNVQLNDSMTVAESLYIDATNLTLNSRMVLTNFYYINTLGQSRLVGLPNWVYTNAPNLSVLTNNGSLTVLDQIHFGDDTARPYQTFVNKGEAIARSITVGSDYFQNSGLLNAGVELSIKGKDGNLTGGSSASGNNTVISCNTLKINGYLMTVNGSLELNVTNALFDAGGGSGNTFTLVNGFRQNVKPRTGDLLGTTINTKADYFADIQHFWAANDRGTTVAGYQDNSAIGKLICSIGNGFPLLSFHGVGATNALYVDQLDITLLGQNYQDYLDIDPDFAIYYASAKLGFTPPGNLTPEEYLNDQFDGRLRWVKDFAGPNSSVDVVSNGVTMTINRALRDSQVIDSDNDGVPNYFDSFPMGGGSNNGSTNTLLNANLVNTGTPGTSAFAITWNAAPNSVYQIDCRTNLMAGAWQVLTRYTNAAPTTRKVTVYDTNAPALAPQRFYRVGLMP